MEFSRRHFIQTAAAVAAIPASPQHVAAADAYPSRPIHLIVQVPAGGSPDIIGRLFADWLSPRLGTVIVENKAGASGNLATELVLRAAPDGYTLLLAMSSNAINPALYDNLNFNFLREAAPVASIATIPLVMVVNPAVPAKTIPEFITYAKANAGQINMATSGVGTPLHVAGELFKMMAGVNMIAVAYRGEASAFPDLLSGRMQVMFSVMPSSLPYIRAGKLRVLGVTTLKRQEVLPDVPAIAEFLPGYDAAGWYGIAAPKGTPADIVNKLNGEINAALADPAMRKRLDDLGCAVFSGTPDDFGTFIAKETAKWAQVVKFAGIKA